MRKSNSNRKLPALRSMQVFEAACRHQSFTAAAEELCITQGAVSRQVQILEQWLGLSLFVRSGPQLLLTSTGEALGQELGQALDIMKNAIDGSLAHTASNHITLSMLPSLATKWFAPRLGRFLQLHTEVDLRVTATRHLVDFAVEDIDLAIRYGGGDWPNLSSQLLGGESITPVCTKEYLQRLILKTPADLIRATLLHSDIKEDWQAWFNAAGIEHIEVPRGLFLGDDGAALQAAIDSQGIALGRSVLVADDIKTGRLIAPFTTSLPTSFSYWLVNPITDFEPVNLTTIKNWLREEFNRSV